ncbi:MULTISPECIES: UvrD-helicase domain-containing protein [unclassified Thiocapsa]|uniref:UvrD-helicase domain-containing protein n=1 Tax=unclassified Thiocapsa TaxID=2641286 RepID=UPI0035AE5ED7
MRILTYRGLDTSTIPGYEKLAAHLAADDFRSADVKKIGDNLYRARLDRSNRLLFALYRHQGERCALILEYIHQHAYEKSRFLARGVAIDEERIPDAGPQFADEAPELPYLNPHLHRFHLLDKVLSFDDEQEQIYRLPPPLVIIGSAGSGKTALTLEKMKDVRGDILYVTRSPFLVQNARALYYANGWENDEQSVDLLSFREYLESVHVPEGKEITPRAFDAWAARQRLPKALKDTHRVFEEFQGAITGTDPELAYLSRDAYLSLGIKQSIFAPEDRADVYELFDKYRRFLDEQGWFDPNLVSHAWLSRVEPRYDFVVVDEVQDLTNVQLLLILRALRDPRRFLLCGDSNQIVHPNFFSWSKVKSLFWHQQGDGKQADKQADPGADLIRILNTNFRNSPQVTEIANRLLHIKHARFGSVDRESNYLVRSRGPTRGRVGLLQDSDQVKHDLDRRTAASARFAILVLHPEQKAEVRRFFRTPLVFSIHEAKGLEYENVLLYGFISGEEKRFRDIATGLDESDLQGELRYARGRDKGDKSLEVFKFYINALYVAVTRAVKNLYLIEPRPKQPLLDLLGLTHVHEGVEDVEEQRSTLDEWRREAHRLELQGKEEQAAEIREQILKQRAVPWTMLSGDALADLKTNALERGDKKGGIALMEYALVYHDQRLLNALIQKGVKAAKHPDKALPVLEKGHYLPYSLKQPDAVLRLVDRYGVDFRNVFGQTSLMIASRMGNAELAALLLERDADTGLVDANGLNAFQIALDRACADERFARTKLPAVFERLAPPALDIQIDGRLVKLDQRLMEYLMLCIAMVLFYQRLGENWVRRGDLLSAVDFAELLAHFPESVVPAKRKKRSYISSILSKNERDRDAPYNRKLFARWRRGQYIINPQLALRVEGEWRKIYEVLAPQRLGAQLRDPIRWGQHVWDPNAEAERAVTMLCEQLKTMSEGRTDERPVRF